MKELLELLNRSISFLPRGCWILAVETLSPCTLIREKERQASL